MSWIVWDEGSLKISRAVGLMEDFETWSEGKGSRQIDRYASEQLSGMFKRSRAKKQVQEAFETFMTMKTFRLALEKEFGNVFNILGNIFTHMEGSTYAAAGKVYVVPRFMVHDQFDQHMTAAIKASTELDNAEVNQNAASMLKQNFTSFFLPRLRAGLVVAMEPREWEEKEGPIEIGEERIVFGVNPDAAWLGGGLAGHYYVSALDTLKTYIDRVPEHKKAVENQIAGLSEEEREELLNKLRQAIENEKPYSKGNGPNLMWAPSNR